ncbi:MAG TPA: WecB/TagA/CpsF family glycosyltransferase [Polyangiaceae bacterium]
MNRRERVRIGGVPIDALTLEQAIDEIERLIADRAGGSVFTPNVDHVVLCREDARLRAAYEATSLSLVDGMPVLWASRLLGRPLPEKVSGSDLVLPLARHGASRGWKFFLLGGAPGVADRASERLQESIEGIRIVGTLAPTIDMSAPASTRAPILEAVRRSAADVVFVGLGAPKQELWIHESQEALRPAVLLGIGASLDFLAGAVPRAPAWISRSGLEWLYRLAREPRRLWKRYLVRDPAFLAILIEDLRRTRRGRARDRN